MQISEALEQVAMNIISNSGAGRSAAFEALAEAKNGNYGAAEAQIKKAKAYLHDAHVAHRDLLTLDARGDVENVSVLLSHAQDHLMTSVLAEELIAEIIILHRKIDDK